jgi:FmdE, Molybdenum formylmethanofuran dehydrogenase operon
MSGVVSKLPALTALLMVVVAACAEKAPPDRSESPHASAHAMAPAPTGVDADLAEVARVHGGAGPWAVAGFRMGRYALKRLALERQSFDLEVIHHSPRKVQFSCMADGAAAATGASIGKLNLSLVDADEAHVATTYRRKSTGARLTLRPSAAFRARFLDVPMDQLGAAGRTAMGLADAEVFEEAP